MRIYIPIKYYINSIIFLVLALIIIGVGKVLFDSASDFIGGVRIKYTDYAMGETFDLGSVSVIVDDYETISEGTEEIEGLSNDDRVVEYTYTVKNNSDKSVEFNQIKNIEALLVIGKVTSKSTKASIPMKRETIFIEPIILEPNETRQLTEQFKTEQHIAKTRLVFERSSTDRRKQKAVSVLTSY